MSERDKILTACGWLADVELPLIAERIVNHSADRIAELEAELKLADEGLDFWQKRSAELEAEPARLQEILLKQTKLNTRVINEKTELERACNRKDDIIAQQTRLPAQPQGVQAGHLLARL